MVGATWNHVGIRWKYILRCVDEASCGEDTHTHSVHLLSLRMTACWVQETVRMEQSTERNLVYFVFGFSSCEGFQQVFGQRFLCSQFPTCSQMCNRISDAVETPSLPSQPKFFFFYADGRCRVRSKTHVLVIVGGVLMEVRAACMMRRMPPKTSDE